MFENFLQQINNRELAILTRIVVLTIGFSLSKQAKSLDLKNLFEAFFHWKICFPMLILILYQVGVVALLGEYAIWNINMLKDSIYAILGVVGILFSLHERKTDFISKLFTKLFQFSLVIEFISSVYIFNYGAELALVFVLTLLSILIAYSENKQEYKSAYVYFQYTINTIYVVYFIVLLRSLILSPGELLQYNTILGFLLPIILAILSLPVLYVYKITMEYEKLFVRMRNIFPNNPELRKKIQWKIVQLCCLNLRKLSKISASNARFHKDMGTIDDFRNLLLTFNNILKDEKIA